MRTRIAMIAATTALLLAAPAAFAHEGSPNFESNVHGMRPAIPGVSLEVLNRDDRLLLVNRSDETIVVEGYDEEPYVRIAPDGTVEVNRRSPALYLNEDRYAQVDVPARAEAEAEPQWERVAGNGRYEWHDHRIHWMSQTTPQQVTDEGVRTKIFDWRVPVTAGGRRASITGELFWTPLPDEGGFPLAAVLSLGGVALLGAGLVLMVRRRRRAAGGREEAEAW